jgi:ureidoglycolate lyase
MSLKPPAENKIIPMKIIPAPLSAEAFAPFGDVIETQAATDTRIINEGNTIRFHDLANLTLTHNDGTPLINIFRTTPLAMPLRLSIMERHPLSSQAFIPLSAKPYLVVVAPAGKLDEAKIKVFLAAGTQGVNYHPGTWHHYSLALESTADFLVVDRGSALPQGDSDDNCDEVVLSDPLIIEI